jgi:two-component system nitrogen regulation sensor histidine kinase NtrY
VLTVLAVVSGLATYVVISRAAPYGAGVGTVLFLLNLNLVLLLLLGAVIARRVTQVLIEWRRGHAGSRLHTRLVALFSVVAVAPAIVVAVFSVFFLSSGLEAWFSDRIRSALQTSLNVAQAYLEEHKENIRADALAMAADLNREGSGMALNLGRLRQVVNAQAEVRSLTEAIVFDGSGRILAQTGLGFTLQIETLPQETFDQRSRARWWCSPATPTTACGHWSGSTASATPTCSSAGSWTRPCWATWSAPSPWWRSTSGSRAGGPTSRSSPPCCSSSWPCSCCSPRSGSG